MDSDVIAATEKSLKAPPDTSEDGAGSGVKQSGVLPISL